MYVLLFSCFAQMAADFFSLKGGYISLLKIGECYLDTGIWELCKGVWREHGLMLCHRDAAKQAIEVILGDGGKSVAILARMSE